MTPLLTIAGMTLGVYGIRLAGFVLADLPLPASLERALRFVPLAMLTALCVATLPGHAGDSTTRFVAATGAAFVARVTRRVWACILSGLALYWLLGWLLGSR
jgi:branched-subunit amino acid transport protein